MNVGLQITGPLYMCPWLLKAGGQQNEAWLGVRWYSGMPGWVQAPPLVWDRVTSPLGVIHCCVYHLLNAVFLRDYSDWTEQEKYAQRQNIRINWGRNIRQGLRSQGSWLYEGNWTCCQSKDLSSIPRTYIVGKKKWCLQMDYGIHVHTGTEKNKW